MPFSPSLIPDDRFFLLVCTVVCLKNTFLPHLLGLDSLANVSGNTKGERAIIAIIISLSLPAPIQCENEMAFSSNVLPCAVPRMIAVHAQPRRRMGSWKTKSGERETHRRDSISCPMWPGHTRRFPSTIEGQLVFRVSRPYLVEWTPARVGMAIQ